MSGHEHNRLAHVMPLPMLVGVFGALVGLTFLTTYLADAGLGKWDLFVGMIIASTKSILVGLFFMHLKYDRIFNAVVFILGLLFVALFIGIVMLDVDAYQPYLNKG